MGAGHVFDARRFDLGGLENRGDELALVALDLGLLHLDLGLFFDLLDLDLLGDDLLLHDVGLQLVGLVGLGFLPAGLLGEGGFLDVEIALRFGLLGE